MITVTVNNWRKVKVTPVIVTGTPSDPVGSESLLFGRKGFVSEDYETLWIDSKGIDFLYSDTINGKKYAPFDSGDYTFKEDVPNV